jgi:hypothetical protein
MPGKATQKKTAALCDTAAKKLQRSPEERRCETPLKNSMVQEEYKRINF